MTDSPPSTPRKSGALSPAALAQDRARLEALAEYGVEGPLADLGLDRVVQLTARIFQAPIVLVSLVEAHRQLFAASVGVTVCETDRKSSFCAHALGSRDLLVVPDAHQDPRFRGSALVTGAPFIRFYAGCPLVAPGGHVIGTLCVIDTVPRDGLSDVDRVNLRDLAGLVLDKLELRRLDLARQASQLRFERIARHSPDAIVCVDDSGIVTFWNAAAERLVGHSSEQVCGRTLESLVPGSMLARLRRLADDDISLQTGKTLDIEVRTAAGQRLPVELSASLWRDDGRVTFCAILRDLSERRRNEARLYRLAHLDPLTELPNRTLLRQRLDETLKQGSPTGVMMIDLDGFKDINDSLGHGAGDAVLVNTARRLQAVIGAGDMAARTGGDEFAVLLPGLDCPDNATSLAQTIIDVLAQVSVLEGHAVAIGASIGIALAPRDGTNVATVLSSADLALYDAKAQGKHGWRFFTPALRDHAAVKRAYQTELERAVRLQEFVAHFQPLIRLADGALVGAEAKLGWQHPDKGILPTAAFLTALEASPFAARVGQELLVAACRQAAAWREQLPAFRLSVDLLDAQFRAGDLPDRVAEALAETGLPAEALDVEITGRVLLRAEDLVRRSLHRLRDMGVGIAFDDYGTAHASLSMLKDFPISRLKIDASFVTGIEQSPVDAAMVCVILFLGRSLGFSVVALGVQTEAQRRRLERKGCEFGQGPLLGESHPAAAFEALWLGETPASS
ncbi:EAL domain-containing protein [Achromobacter sp. GG226]|uniref:putative bifunctional diguanylate cyclase/phosphodiesterase n=1 Tax=Verticiella alkaliphila TaxID=2779529 RepID=UPI001C0D37D6|nr:EAL domain-containing protein [Verticiella sp. GG226]MBU4611447.1 EAL domain-containing protein [Verticiella sp. GG226]